MWLLVKIIAAIAVYGVAIEPRFVNRDNQVARIPNLPVQWEGKQIAAFADIHVGMWMANMDAARRVVRQVVTIHPAAVLIAGDFVYKADSTVNMMPKLLALLQPILDNHIPIYGVLGNHDYSLMFEGSEKENLTAARIRGALRRAGVRMMDNTSYGMAASAADSADSSRLFIVGIGEKWGKNDHPEEALSKVPADAPRIVFMHDPDSFAHIPAGQAPVAVAAHTHGMQIGIPFFSDWWWRHRESKEGSGVAGWISHYGQPGNSLYITRGVGFSTLPVRIHAVPQLVVFTLLRAQDGRPTPGVTDDHITAPSRSDSPPW